MVRFLPVLALVVAGCDPGLVRTTEVRLHDPGRVSIRSGPDASTTVLPEGRTPREANIVDGWADVAADPSVRRRYHLGAVREAGGEVSLQQGPPGAEERYRLVGTDGRVHDLPGNAVTDETLQGPEAVLPVCCCGRTTGRARDRNVFSCPPSGGELHYLATPWDNVREIRRVDTAPNRGLAIMMAFSFSVGPLTVGPIFVGIGAATPEVRTPYVAAGSAAIALGIGLVFAWSRPMFARGSSVVVFPRPSKPSAEAPAVVRW
jgi:hypothetical protein